MARAFTAIPRTLMEANIAHHGSAGAQPKESFRRRAQDSCHPPSGYRFTGIGEVSGAYRVSARDGIEVATAAHRLDPISPLLSR